MNSWCFLVWLSIFLFCITAHLLKGSVHMTLSLLPGGWLLLHISQSEYLKPHIVPYAGKDWFRTVHGTKALSKQCQTFLMFLPLLYQSCSLFISSYSWLFRISPSRYLLLRPRRNKKKRKCMFFALPFFGRWVVWGELIWNYVWISCINIIPASCFQIMRMD